MALATSSHRKNFELKTNHLQELFSVFPSSCRVVGDDPRIATGRGKPAPDIFLLALKCINDELAATSSEPPVRPEECLVFEDSVPGVEAGRRAGMQVIWCPHSELLKEYAGREKEVLAGIADGGRPRLPIPLASDNLGDTVGTIDDGWALLLHTLEDFPYENYGIKLV